MGHPRALLERCIKALSSDYPPESYKYKLEMPIPNEKILPDVQVLLDGELVCVVEIGYTRASKIKKYRELKVPELRWYSMDMEMVLCERPREEKPIEQVVWEEADKARSEGITLPELDTILFSGVYSLLPFEAVCVSCDSEGLPHAQHECLNWIDFHHKKYRVRTECEVNPEHDREGEYSWDDVTGPYCGKFEKLLKHYLKELKERIEVNRKRLKEGSSENS